MDTFARVVVPWAVALAVALGSMLSFGRADAQTLSIGAPAPSPVLEGKTITFRYIVVNPSHIALGKTLSVAYTVGDCTVPSCLTKLPTVKLPAKQSGAIAFTAPLGRRAYTLLLTIDAIHLTRGRDFYVEKHNEERDTFRNYVVVTDGDTSAADCAETSIGFQFMRDDSDHLVMGQSPDPCTRKPTGSWTVLPGGTVYSSPALVLGPSRFGINENRAIHLFFHGPSGFIQTHVWPGKPVVDDAQALTGVTNSATSAPAAFVPDDERIELFYRVDDGTLANKTLKTGWGWSDEIRFPAHLSSAPAATTFARGLDVVVYRGVNGHLWLMARDRRIDNAAPWQPPEDLGGVNLRSSPGISDKSNSDFLVVEYRGPGDKVWESSWDGNTWWSAPVNTHHFP